MMTKNKIILNSILVCAVSLCNITIYAQSNSASSPGVTHNSVPIKNNFEEIINEFYAYAGTIAPEVRQEIVEYRRAVAALNKKKRELYNALSHRAKDFLVKTQNYKKKLPITKQEETASK